VVNETIPEQLKPLVGERYDYVQGHLISKGLKNIFSASFHDQLREPLDFLHSHFDQTVRAKVIEKLRNPPQLYDTLFELNCMRSVACAFPIFYEPRLKNGKSADFGVYLPSVGPVYFECKNPERFRTEAFSKFGNQNKLLAEQLAGTGIVEATWDNSQRIELVPRKRLNDHDLKKFNSAALEAGPTVFKRSFWQPISDLDVHFVPRAQGYAVSNGPPAMQVKVRDQPVSLALENADIVFHPWLSLGGAIERTTNNLLAEARRQLVMPKGGIGVIWLNVRSSETLSTKLNELLANPEYDRILAVFVQGMVYHRTDREDLVKVFTEELGASVSWY
jgi:hypothetical protein